MTADYTIKRGDAGKIFAFQFKKADGSAQDCTGSSNRKFLMKRNGTLKINGTFTFTMESTGSAQYIWQAADVDTPGWYLLEAECTLGTQIITFPTNQASPYVAVLVQDDLG